ncbi:MAG: 30S ribosomal protein S18 1 [Syntrophomonadaceae bacterium]|nr:30S ribosomal protein S18 1 [Bacillota bacterium]
MRGGKLKTRKRSLSERPMRRRVCYFCKERIEEISFKDAVNLRNHTTERGKILPRKISGNCAKHQRIVSLAIKRARFLAILPFVVKRNG